MTGTVKAVATCSANFLIVRLDVFRSYIIKCKNKKIVFLSLHLHHLHDSIFLQLKQALLTTTTTPI